MGGVHRLFFAVVGKLFCFSSTPFCSPPLVFSPFLGIFPYFKLQASNVQDDPAVRQVKDRQFTERWQQKEKATSTTHQSIRPRQVHRCNQLHLRYLATQHKARTPVRCTRCLRAGAAQALLYLRHWTSRVKPARGRGSGRRGRPRRKGKGMVGRVVDVPRTRQPARLRFH